MFLLSIRAIPFSMESFLQVQDMDFKDPNGLSRLVQSLTVSVDDAERFHPPEAALQTKQYLGTIRGHLRHTLRWPSASPAVTSSQEIPKPSAHP